MSIWHNPGLEPKRATWECYERPFRYGPLGSAPSFGQKALGMTTKSLQYNSIAWDSYADGPGRRVVLFLQGCRYRCPWCHSPHTWGTEVKLLFFESLCIGCMRCAEKCTSGVHSFSLGIHMIQRDRCTGCGLCVSECPQSIEDAPGAALKIVPKTSSVQSIYDLMRPQLEYSGALTVSGGEPLLQWDTVKELLTLCKSTGVKTAIETTLTEDGQGISELSHLVDLWLVGLRPIDRRGSLLNVPDESITARNLALLEKDRVCIRYPVIPGYTDSLWSLEKAADIMERAAIQRIEVLPFNSQTAHYYVALGWQFHLEDVGAIDLVNRAGDFFRSRGLKVQITQ